MSESKSEPREVVGFFQTQAGAERAAANLTAAGIRRQDISVLVSSRHGHDTPAVGPVRGVGADEEAGRDATIGAIAGFVAGTILAVIPGIGPLMAVGPITGALGGLGIGAAAGGIVGLLKDHGVTEDEAEFYAEGLRRGGAVVSVRADGGDTSKITRILEDSGSEDVKKLAVEWRQQGWTGFDPDAPAFERTRTAR